MIDDALKPLYEQIEQLQRQLQDTNAILNSSSDSDLKEMALEDIKSITADIDSYNATIESLKNSNIKSVANTDSALTGDCILEIRAGTGGDEAGLFASNLFLMYSRYAESQKWLVEVISKNEGGLGNLKEIVFEIKTENKSKTPYSQLQYESGVHRVQRVPVTESGGRIHTSTATVAILPIVKQAQMQIRTEDLRIDTYRAGGAGGQHVNKTESAIRITHIPTGIVAQCQDERSQLKNRERAMSILSARLYEAMQRQQKGNLDDLRSEQVGTGERSEKIRTYNFPQDRVTDHRIKQSWFGLNRILMGEIGDILKDIKLKIENPEQITSTDPDPDENS